MKKKILTLEQAADLAARLRTQGKSVVLCHGTFDLLHLGHVRYFDEAKQMGDALFVSVTADRFIKKGPGRPVFSLEERMEMISALAMVDYVIPSEQPLSVEVITALRPNLYVKGPDYSRREQDPTGGIYAEEAAATAVGGVMTFTTGRKWSSTKLLETYQG